MKNTNTNFLSFPIFFNIVNGFEMNEDQYRHYHDLCCSNVTYKHTTVMGYRQCGMSTLMMTMLLYDEQLYHQSVLLITKNEVSKEYHLGILNRMYTNLGNHIDMNIQMLSDIQICSINRTVHRAVLGRSYDKLYIENDNYRTTLNKHYRELAQTIYPIISIRKGGWMFTMGTYEMGA